MAGVFRILNGDMLELVMISLKFFSAVDSWRPQTGKGPGEGRSKAEAGKATTKPAFEVFLRSERPQPPEICKGSDDRANWILNQFHLVKLFFEMQKRERARLQFPNQSSLFHCSRLQTLIVLWTFMVSILFGFWDSLQCTECCQWMVIGKLGGCSCHLQHTWHRHTNTNTHTVLHPQHPPSPLSCHLSSVSCSVLRSHAGGQQ